MSRGFGLSADSNPEVIVEAAVRAEALGFDSFWISHGHNEPRFEALALIAQRTETISLGIGVVPLSSVSPAAIVAEINKLSLPLERLVLGVGSGESSTPLSTVRAGIQQLRRTIECAIFVGGLGPRMCELAGSYADGLLLSWTSPDHARTTSRILRKASIREGRPDPKLLAYLRVALGRRARERVQEEFLRYSRMPYYARHFSRSGISDSNSALAISAPGALASELKRWGEIVDGVVIRPLRSDENARTVHELLEAAILE